MRWLRRGLIAVIVVIAAASVIDADWGGTLPQLQAAAPVAALFLPLLALLLLRWSPRGALVLVLSALVILAPLIPDAATRQERSPLPAGQAPAGTITVLSANAYFGQEDPGLTLEQVRRLLPDVLVLAEESAEHFAKLESGGIRQYLPYATGSLGGSGATVVFTREPVTCPELPAGLACGQVRHEDQRPGSGTPDGPFDMPVVRLANGTLLKAVHSFSPRLTADSRWHAELSDLIAWRDARPPGERVVLAGDFNASRSHPVLRRLMSGMAQAPSGYLPWTRTWPHGWFFPRFVQLDHVLARGYEVAAAGILPATSSDHFAIWAQLTPR